MKLICAWLEENNIEYFYSPTNRSIDIICNHPQHVHAVSYIIKDFEKTKIIVKKADDHLSCSNKKSVYKSIESKQVTHILFRDFAASFHRSLDANNPSFFKELNSSIQCKI